MPCWYFERKEIKNSPSSQDGIDTATENRYRKEGARFIIDAGTKMGLRYDTCATGVVYFHRFYMFHSFKDFYRYVTAACCLFLAGKVEETPKKCKDIIKIAQSLLPSSRFQRFGEDPREEVITMERILLKTIKFDLQVEHPYSFMLKYAKFFKGEKDKTQKMAQMAWTFINDSLCTTLSLQWEPEIIAVSLMYLASRLTKFEPHDWNNRNSSKSKWWEDIIEGMSMELMEDICHQVLDLYSSKQKKLVEAETPPQSPAKGVKPESSPPPPPPPLPDRTPSKKSRANTPSETEQPSKKTKTEKDRSASKVSISSSSTNAGSLAASSAALAGAPIPVAQHITPKSNSKKQNSGSQDRIPASASDTFTAYNPYVSSQMYSSSFMSQEGSQNIQSILAGGSSGPPPPSNYPEHHNPTQPPPHPTPDTSQYPPPAAPATSYSYPPPPQAPYAPPPIIPPPHSYPPTPTTAPSYDPYPPPRNPSYPPVTYAPAPVTQAPIQHHSYPPPTAPPPQSYGGYNYPPAPSHGTPPTHVPPLQAQPPPGVANRYPPPIIPYPNQPPLSTGNAPGYGGPPRHYPKHGPVGGARKDIPALTEIKITGRPEWNLKK